MLQQEELMLFSFNENKCVVAIMPAATWLGE